MLKKIIKDCFRNYHKRLKLRMKRINFKVRRAHKTMKGFYNKIKN